MLSNTHNHNFLGHSHDENTKRTLWVVAITACMMAIEIVAGYITGSMALLADGFHMATHAGALSIAAFAYIYAKKNADNRNFSFGTGKVGDLAGFSSALLLGIIAIGIGIESMLRILQPVKVAFNEAAIIAVIGLLVNIASAFLLSGGNHHHHHGHNHEHSHGHGHDGQDNNLRSAYVHVLADALTSILAIAALLAGKFFGWVWLDPFMGIVGAVVIGRWSLSLLRDTSAILLDKTDNHVLQEVEEIVATKAKELNSAIAINDIHIWQIGPDAHGAILSIATSAIVDDNMVRIWLQPVHEIAHLTIEIHKI